MSNYRPTLFEVLTDWLYQQRDKYEYDVDYPEQYINNMSNWELLEEISHYLDNQQEKTK